MQITMSTKDHEAAL